jgi:hypothetical protein
LRNLVGAMFDRIHNKLKSQRIIFSLIYALDEESFDQYTQYTRKGKR